MPRKKNLQTYYSSKKKIAQKSFFHSPTTPLPLHEINWSVPN